MPTLTERANEVRRRIPFAYWLAYDAVLAPLLVWGFIALSPLFVIGIIMLALSAFFDTNEAIAKWSMRNADSD